MLGGRERGGAGTGGGAGVLPVGLGGPGAPPAGREEARSRRGQRRAVSEPQQPISDASRFLASGWQLLNGSAGARRALAPSNTVPWQRRAGRARRRGKRPAGSAAAAEERALQRVPSCWRNWRIATIYFSQERQFVLTTAAGGLELSLGKFRNVLLNRTNPVEAVIRNIASNVTVVIFQVHAQQSNVVISFDKNPSVNSSGIGVDKGLVSILRPQQTVCTWYLRSLDASQVLSTAISIPYMEKDPIPGGCNLEFDLEVDPNIYLDYTLADIHIKFAPANLGYTRGANPPSCDSGTGQNSRWRLQYDVYQYFLPENDLSEMVLMSHIRKMSEVQSIKGNGIKMLTLTADDKTNVYFSSLPGQGVIYNVIVWDPLWNTSAAYIPVHTYACSFTDLVDNCSSLSKLSTKVFFTALAVVGLFTCFFGHRFWKTDLFFMGFIFTAFFFFVFITRVTGLGYDVRLILTAVAGIIGGLLLAASWWRFGSVLLCMFIIGLVLGFLFSSTVFFTPLGDYRVFRDDVVFWVTFSCVALMIPVLFVGCPRILNILASGIVGSYAVVLAIACYVYTSLAYITLDLLRRVLNDYFSRAYTNVPFQTNDFIILSVWAMLALSGVTVQLRRERSEVPFPPHPYLTWKRERERRSTNVLDPSHHIPPLRERIHNKLLHIKEFFQKEQPAGERTPLLL